MIKKGLVVFFIIASVATAKAQSFSNTLQGEFGISVGAANYFGDLNPRSNITHPKPALGVYFLKEFDDYLGMRVSAHFAEVGYSDAYNTNNQYLLRQNLSFDSYIWELAVNGEFNFFKYDPTDEDHLFTPYISLGVGIFRYDPFAYLYGKKVYLEPLGTEGQNIGYKGADGAVRKPYGSMAFCFPIGFGVKYSINPRTNFSFQIIQRLTTTDYIDDVSTTYVGANKFVPGSNAALLQDRSYETGSVIGVEGRQRGWSSQKDQYVIAEIGISINLNKYTCPTAN